MTPLDAAMVVGALIAAALTLPRLRARLLLSKAKHRSLQGHARWSQRLSKLVPFYEYDGERFFSSDGAPAAVAETRHRGFLQLARRLTVRAPETIRLSDALRPDVSDLQFTSLY